MSNSADLLVVAAQQAGRHEHIAAPSPYSDPRRTPPVGHRPPAVPYARAGRYRPAQGIAPTRYAALPVVMTRTRNAGPQDGGPVAFGRVAPGPAGPYYLGPQVPGSPENHPPAPPQDTTPPELGTPWWQRDGLISTVLAGLGVLVTLIGVVMMLVLAAQAGYFGPAARVSAGAGLSVLLIAGGGWLYGRAGGRTGAVALATTGFAGLFMVVVSMTTYYDWLPPVTGLVVAGFVAGAAVALSTYWRSQPMTIMAFLAIAGLAPFITHGVTLSLLGFLLVLQVAGIAPEKLRGWTSVAPVRTVPVVVVLLILQVESPASTHAPQITAAAVCGVVGLLCALVRGEKAEWAGALVYVVASLPILAAIPTIDRPLNILAGAIVAVVTVASMVIARPVRAVTMSAGAVVASWAALEACFSTTRGHVLPAMIAVVALGLLSAAHQQRSVPVWSIGVFFSTLAAVAQCVHIQPSVICNAGYAVRTVGSLDALSSFAVAAAILGTLWSARRVLSFAAQLPLLVIAPVPFLWSAVVSLLSTGVVIGGIEGYHTAQLIISALLMAAAMIALNAGLRRDSNTGTCTATGLVLVSGALTKLFLYDLAALDGLVRAGSFLAVGLLLLAAGTRYAQAVARRTPAGPVAEGTADRPPIG